jgi:hypothetical protein
MVDSMLISPRLSAGHVTLALMLSYKVNDRPSGNFRCRTYWPVLSNRIVSMRNVAPSERRARITFVSVWPVISALVEGMETVCSR